MKTRKKLTALLLVVLMLLSVLSGAAVADSSSSEGIAGSGGESTIVLAQSADPPGFDPHKTSGDLGANVFRNIFETLTTYDAENHLVPELAESWERTGENEWVFKLKPDIKFSNGEPFNAEAVGWNLERGVSDEYPRQAMEYRNYYGGYEVVDELTIKIITKVPDFLMAEHMADVYMMAPGHGDEVGEDALVNDPVGTGPYLLDSWVKDQQIVLKKNVDYHKGEPAVETYIIRTIPEAATRVAELVNGTVDIIYDPNFEYLPMLEAQGNLNIVDKVYRRISYIAFNTTDWSPAQELQDKRVRQAINYAVDKKAIIDNIMGGFGYEVASIWRPDFPEYDPELAGFEYNPDKARELLAEAGLADGFSLTIQTTLGNHAKSIEVCQAVAQYLADVGIDATVEPMENNAMRNVIINGQDQKLAQGMFEWSWASRPTLYESWLTGIVHSTGMSSYNRVEGFDELIDEILALGSAEERAPLLREMQEKLLDDPPFLYLFQMSQIYVSNDRIDWDASQHQYMLAYEMKLK